MAPPWRRRPPAHHRQRPPAAARARQCARSGPRSASETVDPPTILQSAAAAEPNQTWMHLGAANMSLMVASHMPGFGVIVTIAAAMDVQASVDRPLAAMAPAVRELVVASLVTS